MSENKTDKPALEGEHIPKAWAEKLTQARADEATPTPGSVERENKPDEPSMTTADILYPLCEFATAVLCPKWKIKPDENKMLAENYGALIDKYFPDSMGKFGVELNCLLTTAAVFAPHVLAGEPAREPEPEPVKKPEKTPEANASE